MQLILCHSSTVETQTGTFHHLSINFICLAVFTLSSATASGWSVSTLQGEEEEPELQVHRLRPLAASPVRLLRPCCSLNLAFQVGLALDCRAPPSPCPPSPMAPPQAPTTLPAPAPQDTQIEKESGGLSAGGALWSAARNSQRVQRLLVAPVSVSLRGWRAPGGA